MKGMVYRNSIELPMPENQVHPRILGSYFVHRLLRAADFQDRPEFEKVRRWWRNHQAGLCALTGIGGAGKTAILERFLRVLPNGLEQPADLAKDTTLVAPHGVMVFSFYDAPNPQIFFGHLYAWLKGMQYQDSETRVSYNQTLAVLRATRLGDEGLLLCLDGLEKVQDDGLRGGIFGAITDSSLKDLVERIADGYLPNVRTIITTRFPVASLEEELPGNYVPIAVDELTEDSAAALLRKHQVQGETAQLLRLARECGCHALTVDLVGNYLYQFHGGDSSVRMNLPSQVEVAEALQLESNPLRRRFLKQSLRFSRVAGRYREALAAQDPAALALLERICLFRLPVELEMLARIFIGEGKDKISGKALAGLDPKLLDRKLDLLTEMRLIEVSRDRTYSIHPAVRDGFLKGISTAEAQQGHRAAYEFLSAQLGEQPGEDRLSLVKLDLIEEIVYHTMESGHEREAWSLFLNRMDAATLAVVGQCQRVERLCRALSGVADPSLACPPEGVVENDFASFLLGWGLALKSLGNIGNAVIAYKRFWQIALAKELNGGEIDHDRLTGAQVFLCEAAVLAGRLPEAQNWAESAIIEAEKSTDADKEISIGVARSFRLYTQILRANHATAREDLQIAYQLKDVHDSGYLALFHGDWIAKSLLCLGRTTEAARFCEELLEAVRRDPMLLDYQVQHRLYLALAEVDLETRNLVRAREYCTSSMEWARMLDLSDVLCEALLTGSRIALAEAEQAHESKAALLQEAEQNSTEGLRIARSCGFGILHIDLLIARAKIWLIQGKPVEAEHDLRAALFEGMHPQPDSDLPILPAAVDPDCGYTLGEAEGRLRLGETLLSKAASSPHPPQLIQQSLGELRRSRDLFIRMQDPRAKDIEQLILKTETAWDGKCPPPSIEAAKLTAEDTAPERKAMEAPVDFVIIAPLEEERDALLSKFKVYWKLPPSDDDIRVYFAAYLPVEYSDGSKNAYKVIVVPLASMGQEEAANATTDATRRWKPRFVLLLGIAGGLKSAGVQLGDVLVADQIANYELQKLTEEKAEIRWKVHPVNHQLLLASKNYLGNSWLELVTVKRPDAGRPSRKTGVICTGNKVIANGLANQYRDVWERLIGVEMEAGGVAGAAFSRVKPPGFFMVRGVSDLADKDKDALSTANWRSYACDVAASYLVGFLASGPVTAMHSTAAGMKHDI